MIYIGEFSNIIGRTFRLEVITNNDATASSVLTMSGDSPAVIKYEGDSDNIYKPIKYSSLTFKILVKDYLFDFFASTATQNHVQLFDTTGEIYSLMWEGYLTPNLYSNGYESEEEEMTVECVDDLAVLKYIDYQPISNVKNVVNIKDIIAKYMNHNYVKFANNPWILNFSNIIFNSQINEQNFFDEDDKPEKVSDVLEQICQYFNLTLTTNYSDGQLFYVFFDYDYLKNIKQNTNNAMALVGRNGVIKDGHSDSGTCDTSIVSSAIDIDHNSYAENGQTISLGEVYSKVSLKDSLYSYDSIIPEIFDDENLTNIGSAWTSTQVVPSDYLNSLPNNCDVSFNRYYVNSQWNTNFYQLDNTNGLIHAGAQYYENNERDWNHTKDSCGCLIKREYTKNLPTKETIINKLSFTDYLLLFTNYSRVLVGAEKSSQKKIIFDKVQNEIETSVTSAHNGMPVLTNNQRLQPNQIIGGDNVYIVISGNIEWSRRRQEYLNTTNQDIQDSYKAALYSDCFITCRLKVGDKYWNNDITKFPDLKGGIWQTEPCTFRLYATDNQSLASHFITIDGVSLPLYNNVNWAMNVDEEGYAIKLDKAMVGKIEFSIFAPHNVWVNNPLSKTEILGNMSFNVIDYVEAFVKNLKIKTVVATDNNTSVKDYDKDTEYTVNISDKFIEEKKLDDWKICTFDYKKISYSTVIADSFNSKKNEYELVMIDNVYDKIYNTNLRPEQHAIERYVSQYGTPTITLNLCLKDYGLNNYGYLSMFDTFTDKFLPNKLFIVNSIEKDIMYNKADIELIEKK